MSKNIKIDYNLRKYIRRIFWVGAIFILITLCWFHYFFFDFEGFIPSLLIEFIAAIIIFIFIYLLFQIRGIRVQQILDIQRPLWLINGFETNKKIDWHKYFKNSNNITIVAFYFENWIAKHDDDLREFMRKKNTTMKVFIPNYLNEQLLTEISGLIPKYTPEELKEKIILTIKKLADRCLQEQTTKPRVEIWLYNHVFNYTLQAFDNTLLFSINELCRKDTYKSPFIEINLAHSLSIEKFFKNEIATLTTGEKLVLSKFTTKNENGKKI